MPAPNFVVPPQGGGNGNKYHAVKIISGPASYTQVTTGAAPTGGQVVLASDLGLKNIEAAFGSGSDDGQYDVVVIFDGNPGVATTQVRLLWRISHTGAEVTGAVNLSARSIRLWAQAA